MSFRGLETDPRATDEALLALANQEQRVLITEDKDFGELGLCAPLYRIRVSFASSTCRLRAMRELIKRHADAMHDGALIVVTRRRVRIRPGKRDTKGND